MGTQVSEVWAPQPGPQTAFMECPVFEVFFGGARGGGKSDAILGEFASHAGMYGQDAIALCVRRELTQLRELIERSKLIYNPLGANYVDSKKQWTFPNGARLTFAYLEHDQDADAYQGHSYSRIYVEEIGNFPRSEPIFKLMATIRSGNPEVKVGFRATGNPGGPGHLWVKRRYIDPGVRGYKVVKSKFINPFTNEIIYLDRVFIPSKVTENKYTNNPGYIARLQMSGGPMLVKAWLEGNWDYIEGAFFQEWDNELHVIPQFIIPLHWTRFCSMDWGSAHPFSVGWWAIVPERFESELVAIGDEGRFNARFQYQNNLPRGALVRYREWYGCQVDKDGLSLHNNVGLKLDIEELSDGIAQRERFEIGRGARIAYRVAGKDLFKHEGGPSLGERMGAEPFRQFWQPADNARVGKKGAIGGWDMLRLRLKGEDGLPMIYFFENCVDAIRTLPAMQHDPDNIEDVDTESEDHCPDEIRYACMSRPYTRLMETKGPDRIFSIGHSNQIVINDVMDDVFMPLQKRVPRFERIQ
jgi:Terminase large subunit, T4likevirus-type, N-terminal